jgi:hypothetical protein
VGGYAGDFSLATTVEGHPAGALVPVTVSAPRPSQLVLDLSDHTQVQTDACVLLCGHVGTMQLLELGYTGRLVRRPRLAAPPRSNLPESADAAPPPTDAP